jgi:hypothetical protein
MTQMLLQANYIFPGREPAGAGALRQTCWTRESGPLTRALNKPLDPGLRPALRRGRPLLHPLCSKTQRGTPQPFLLLYSGDENGVRPPWTATSLTLASKGRIIKGKGSSADQGGRGVLQVCNTSP